MAYCDHIDLVQVFTKQQLFIRDEGRLGRVLSDLTRPSTQYPSFLSFLGRKAKDRALIELFPFNRIKKGSRNSIATLQVDSNTLGADNPIYFADSDIKSPGVISTDLPRCHTVENHFVTWHPPADHYQTGTLQARLLFLFTDVICLFAEDVGGFQNVANQLQDWAAFGCASYAPRQLRPRMIVVVPSTQTSPTHDILELENLRFNLSRGGSPDALEAFSEISKFQLAGDHVSPLARYRELKTVLLRHAKEMRQLRASQKLQFSATHLSRLFSQGVLHTATTLGEPFDVIAASRRENPVAETLGDHVVTFLRLGIRYKMSFDVMASIIASSILVDAYPPGMHSKYSSHPLKHISV